MSTERLIPEKPLYTVCLTVVFPFDAEDIDDEDEEDDDGPIFQSIVLHIRAASPSVAIENAVVATTKTLAEDDAGDYALTVAGVFEGALTDLTNDYEPTPEFLAAEERLDSAS